MSVGLFSNALVGNNGTALPTGATAAGMAEEAGGKSPAYVAGALLRRVADRFFGSNKSVSGTSGASASGRASAYVEDADAARAASKAARVAGVSSGSSAVSLVVAARADALRSAGIAAVGVNQSAVVEGNRTVINLKGCPNTLTLSNDGHTVYAGVYGLYVIEGEIIRHQPFDGIVSSIAMTPDSKHLVVTMAYNNDIYILDARKLKTLKKLDLGFYGGKVHISPDGKKAYITQTVTVTGVIDMKTFEVEKISGGGFDFAFSSDGRWGCGRSPREGNMTIFDMHSHNFTDIALDSGIPVRFAMHPKKDVCYVTYDFGGNVSIVDMGTHEVTTVATESAGVCNTAITPDGSQLYMADSTNNSVLAFNTGTYVHVRINTGIWPMFLTASEDGNYVFVSNHGNDGTGTDGSVSQINTANNTVVRTFDDLPAQPMGLVVSPDGHKLVVGSYPGVVEYDL